MATRYAIQHIGTGYYLSVVPSLIQPPLNAFAHEPSAEEAATYRTMTQAEMECIGIPDFSGAYHVVPVSVSSIYDKDPDEEVDGADLEVPLT